MAGDLKREQVHFKHAKSWDNYPGFGTRLDHSFARVYSFIFDSRIMVPVIFFLLLCVFTIISISKDRFIEGLLTLSGTLIVAYVGLVVTIYWNLDSVFGRKWALYFERWYEINNIESATERNMHFYNLYMDVITMKLWGDSAISKSFRDALIVAIKNAKKDQAEDLLKKLDSKEMDVYEAYSYLSEYASKLADKLVKEQKLRKRAEQDSASFSLIAKKSRANHHARINRRRL